MFFYFLRFFTFFWEIVENFKKKSSNILLFNILLKLFKDLFIYYIKKNLRLYFYIIFLLCFFITKNIFFIFHILFPFLRISFCDISAYDFYKSAGYHNLISFFPYIDRLPTKLDSQENKYYSFFKCSFHLLFISLTFWL